MKNPFKSNKIEEEKEQILAFARTEAEQITKAAREQAEEILHQAKMEAGEIRVKAADALKVEKLALDERQKIIEAKELELAKREEKLQAKFDAQTKNDLEDKLQGFNLGTSSLPTADPLDVLNENLSENKNVAQKKEEVEETVNESEEENELDEIGEEELESKKQAIEFEITNTNFTEKEEDMARIVQHENEEKFLLPNGMVGKAYSEFINFEEYGIDDLAQEIKTSGLEDTGLSFNNSTRLLEGTPTLDGEQVFILSYKLEEDMPTLSKKFLVLINPDPKSLWKNKEPEPGQLFPKDHGVCERELGIEKTVIAASKRGRSHAHNGTFRDDDFKIKITDEKWYIVAVADGAGSAQYSREGARLACNAAVATIEKIIHDQSATLDDLIEDYQKTTDENNTKKVKASLYDIIGKSVVEARSAISEAVKESESSLRDFSTTLLVSICKKFDFGYFVAAYWVGDGVVGIYNQQKEINILGDPDGGEFAGQTRFLTMKEILDGQDILNRIRFDIVEDFTALILMTDGVSDPIFETDSKLKKIEEWDRFWTELTENVTLSNADSEQQLLNWLDFWSPGNHDDRTIAIVF